VNSGYYVKGIGYMNKVKLLDFIPGYRCNSFCIFCSISEELRDKNLSSEKAYLLLDKHIKLYEPEEVRIGGGEPTIRKDLPNLIELAKKSRVKNISIQTNGYMLSYDEYLEKIVRSGLNKVRLSFRASDSNSYRLITRVDNSFEYVDRALKNIKKFKLKTIVDIVLLRNILDKLEDIIDFLSMKGIKDINIWSLWYEGRAVKNTDTISYLFSDASELLKRIVIKYKKLRIKIMYFPLCVLGKELIKYYWNPADEECIVVTPSETFELNAEGFMNISRLKKCNMCKYNKRCIGISKEYIDIFGDKEIKPLK